METNRFSKVLICLTALIFSMLSCGERNYRMITRIDSDGSCRREIYARGDSAFLSGDMTHNPFLFTVDSVWRIVQATDAGNPENFGKNYNVMIVRDFRAVKELSAGLQSDKNLQPFALPKESLEKKFQWFYTRYTFKGTYANLSDKVTIPADNYLSKEEQALWFQGNLSRYKGMNGMELKAGLDDIETAFFLWWRRNVYEESFNAVRHCAERTGDSTYLSQLEMAKDTLFAIHSKDVDMDFEPVDVCNMLDRYYGTNRFSALFNSNEQSIKELYDERMSPLDELNSISIEYNLIMPGELLHTNAGLISQDTLLWKVDAIRLISEDYVITAESRVFHPWALAATFLLAAISVFCLLKAVRKQK